MDQYAIETALNILSARPESQGQTEAINIAAAELAVALWEEAGGGPDLRPELDVLKANPNAEERSAARKRCRKLYAGQLEKGIWCSGPGEERKFESCSWAALTVRAALKPPGYSARGPWEVERLDACPIVCVRHILDLLAGGYNILNFPKSREYVRLAQVAQLAQEMIGLHPKVKDAAEQLAAIVRSRQAEDWITAANRAYSAERAQADIGLVQHRVDAWIKSRDV